MKQLQFFKIGFWVLLILNIILSTMAIFAPENRHPRAANLQPQQGNQLTEILQFSEDQKREFEGLVGKHRRSMRALQAQSRDLLNAYFNTLKIGNAEEGEKIYESLEELEPQKFLITYEHFEEVRALCTEDQLRRFPQAIDGALNMILRDTRGNRPGPPRPPGRENGRRPKD